MRLMTLSIPFKSKLNALRHRGGGNGKLPVDEISRLYFFCNFVTSKGDLIEKVLPLVMAWARVGRDDI